jgi:hypothetical protein
LLLQLTHAQARVARLEREIATLQAALRALPGQFGFQDLTSFLRAVKAATKAKPRRRHPKIERFAPPPGPAIAAGMAAASNAIPAAGEPPPITPAPAAATPPPAPSAGALDLPAPPAELPPRGALPNLPFRQLLTAELERANRALHDRTTPPLHWAAWKNYAALLRHSLAAL